jgi:hypothetical protein
LDESETSDIMDRAANYAVDDDFEEDIAVEELGQEVL